MGVKNPGKVASVGPGEWNKALVDGGVHFQRLSRPLQVRKRGFYQCREVGRWCKWEPFRNKPRGICRVTVLTLYNWGLIYLITKTCPDLSLRMGSHAFKGSKHQVMHIRKALRTSATWQSLFTSLPPSFCIIGPGPFPKPWGTKSGENWPEPGLELPCPRPTNSQRLTSSCDCSDSLRTGLVWGVGGSDSLLKVQ